MNRAMGKRAKIPLEGKNQTEMTTVLLREAMSLPSSLPLGASMSFCENCLLPRPSQGKRACC